MPDLRIVAAQIEGAPLSCELAVSGNVTSTHVSLFQEALSREVAQRRVILVLLLREVEGLSCEEIATTLALPMGTVKSRLARGRDSLRRALALPGEEMP